jgi:hypothetical protein
METSCSKADLLGPLNGGQFGLRSPAGIILQQNQMFRWWAHKGSDLGPADLREIGSCGRHGSGGRSARCDRARRRGGKTVKSGIEKVTAFYRGYLIDDRSLTSLRVALTTIMLSACRGPPAACRHRHRSEAPMARWQRHVARATVSAECATVDVLLSVAADCNCLRPTMRSP